MSAGREVFDRARAYLARFDNRPCHECDRAAAVVCAECRSQLPGGLARDVLESDRARVARLDRAAAHLARTASGPVVESHYPYRGAGVSE